MKIDHPYVQKFQKFWSAPNTADIFRLLVHEEIELLQPLTPPLKGRSAVEREFDALFKVVPDICGEVTSYAEDSQNGILFICWIMTFPLGNTECKLPVVDAIVLRDGKATQRTAHMDVLPVLAAIIMRPWLWLRWGRFLLKL